MVRHLTPKYAQAGVKACLLTFFQPEATVYYTTPQLDTIGTLGLSFQAGLSALVEGAQGNLFSETYTSDRNGRLYVQVVNLSSPQLTADRRTLMEAISRGRAHALIQDMDGQWWLYGQERGLKLRYKTDTDTFLTISLSGMEREPARLVSPNLIPGFLAFLN
ncbi:hypothetical protein [Rufibacter quisquiliarum]|uniref:Uncharacterized protein n=1 Tax=Rufibacter quisquiliarum TaxID=1549639 RepID=A0A839GCI6_9BACT|nr:hypothetical protein [Rufibacter quisquiliarum]MBA9076070.1 hypothetical protein [Rufibacter quisquiliarum]